MLSIEQFEELRARSVGSRRQSLGYLRLPTLADLETLVTAAANLGDGRARMLEPQLRHARHTAAQDGHDADPLHDGLLDYWLDRAAAERGEPVETFTRLASRDRLLLDLQAFAYKDDHLITPDETPAYLDSNVTERPADQIARKFGFPNVTQFAASLPAHARVLELGAGFSDLGAAVARTRSDVRWISADLIYQHALAREDLFSHLGADLPTNLIQVAMDATEFPKSLRPGQLDLGVSWWALPYLSMEDDQPARDAVAGLLQGVKPGGTLFVGPNMRQSGLPLPPGIERTDDTGLLKIAHNDPALLREHVQAIVGETRLVGTEHYLYRAYGRQDRKRLERRTNLRALLDRAKTAGPGQSGGP